MVPVRKPRPSGEYATYEMPRSRQVGSVSSARVPVEERVLGLHGADRMHGVRARDGGRRGLRQADVAHLALLDEPRHRAHRVLDRHLGVDAVLGVEVDDVDAEPLQARVARPRHVGGAAVDEVALAVRALDLAELGGEHDLVAPSLDRAAEQLFVLAPAVHVRGVEEVDPEVERLVDHGDRLGVVPLAVDARHGHAAEPDGRDAERAVPERAIVHDDLLSWGSVVR